MKKISISLAFLAISILTNAQQFDFTAKREWQEQPQLHDVNPKFDSSSAVGILDDRKIEYKLEGNDVFVYITKHIIVKVIDDKGIETFNKVYILVLPNAQVSDIKARTILPGGKTIDADLTKIKETQEDGNTYKIFAMDGVEKGSEIEYMYTIKRNFYLFSSELFQNQALPYQQEFFTLITPKNIKFSVKGYNDFKVSPDTLIDDKRIVVGYDVNVPELDDEKYAYREQYLKRVDYKFSYNLAQNPDVRLYTWQEFAKKALSIYTTRTVKEAKALEDFVAKINLDDAPDDAVKIIKIEDYIKTNINIDKKLISEDASAIDKIVKTKNADDEGIAKLFAAVFDRLSIPYQLVFAGDRSAFPIDEELENWNRIDPVLFYFPQTKKYIDPASPELRYPFVPFDYTETKGIFIKSIDIGNFSSATANFENVAMEPFSANAINMEAEINFDETLDTLLIKSKQILKGYGAAQYRPIYVFLPKDKQDEFNLDIIKSVGNSSNISNIKVENTQLTDYATNKPLIISGDIKSTELLENAGSRILLKIGEIIGPQVEMYQEKPRQMPVELPFPHTLERKIILHIPDGYSVKNLNDLNFNIVYKNGADTTMGFVCTYTQNKNDINILISETYHQLRYPIAQFDDFKKVINASADFNKVVLVLQKNN